MNKKTLLLGLVGLAGTCYGAVTITTPTVNTGELIRAGDWNKIRADLVSLSSTLDILGNQTWQSSGSDMYYLNGAVGVGIAIPPAQLSVYKPAPAANESMFQIGKDSDDNKFKIDEDGDTQMDGTLLVRGGTIYDSSGSLELNGEDNVYVGIDWNDNDAENRSFIIGKNDAGPGDDWEELMRVTESGRVGIGTASPSAQLDILLSAANSTAVGMEIDGGSGAPDLNFRVGSDSTNHNGSDINITAFGVGTGSQNLRFEGGNWGTSYTFSTGSNAGQKVLASVDTDGVGTGGSTHYGRLRLYETTDAQTGYNSTVGAGTANVLLTAELGQNSFINSGNVGIGTTTPTQRLEVNGITLSNSLRLRGSYNNSLGLNLPTTDYAHFRSSSTGGYMGGLNGGGYLSSSAYFNGTDWRTGGNRNSAIEAHWADGLKFYTDLGLTPNGTFTPTERMRITSAGNVGIGTTTPASDLDVAGTIRAEEICDESGANCQDISSGWATGGGGSSGSGGSTMVSGWPDAIKCNMTSPNWGAVTFYQQYTPFTDGDYWYRTIQSSGDYSIRFNSDGSFAADNLTSDCDSESIADLYTSGKAFNFVGGSGSGGSGGSGTSETMYKCPLQTTRCYWEPDVDSNRPPLCGGQYSTSDECVPGLLDLSLSWCSASSAIACEEVTVGGASSGGASGGSDLVTNLGLDDSVWPWAIKCPRTPDNVEQLQHLSAVFPDGRVGYAAVISNGAGYYKTFTSTGNHSAQNSQGTACDNESLSQICADGRCIFGGGSESGSGSGSGGGGSTSSLWTESGGNITRASGNVGIGTTNPDESLTVAGGAKFTKNLSSWGQAVLELETPSQTYPAVLRLKAGNLGVGGLSIGHTGTSYPTSSLRDSTFISTRGANGLSITAFDGADTADIRFQTSGEVPGEPNPKMIVKNNGNVGIGTPTPTAKLYIRGQETGAAISRSQLQSGSALTIAPHTSWSTNMNVGLVNNGNGMGIQVTNGSATADWDIALNPFGGNVGIGTTAPISPLHVFGGPGMTAGYTRSVVVNGDHPTIQFKGISDTNRSAFIGYDAQSTSEALHFWTGHSGNDNGGSGTAKMSIKANGYVGIGTTNPAAKLTVNGRIRALADGGSGYVASSTHLMSHNNYRGAGTFSYGQSADWFWGNPYTNHGGAFIIARSGASGGSSEAVAQYSNATVIVTSNDRVGINTIVPQTTLDVTGGFMQTRYNKGNATVCYYTHSSSKVSFGPCSSSRKYKENISNLSLGLETIDLLRPVQFDWKKDQKTDYGLIAEEVAETVPHLAIYGDNNQVESVNYQSLTAILTKALQELKTEKDAEITELKARLDALESAQ